MKIICFEDCTQMLHEYWGQIIFDYGGEELEKIIENCDGIISAKCRYGLFIVEKVK